MYYFDLDFVRGSALLLLLNTFLNQSQARTAGGAVRLGLSITPHHSALQGRQAENLS